ncbi:uncharacterized protein N7459_001011 [Penicillium hispanicum]|uniref:uncharacterized protein n=1 Tax=Penicillium hispanicum TaxID=1080232 RepID=UPI0025425922|nr:uncharacterized protein N7459_001011 [Penicillium hispanicum]KAJ5594803.1 hypothetical protein N7459_001011 [Penicillium hispanicum]
MGHGNALKAELTSKPTRRTTSLGIRKTDIDTTLDNGNITVTAQLRATAPHEDAVDTEMQSAFDRLQGRVDLFIIDAQAHTSFGKDPLWEIPLAEWCKEDASIPSQQQQLLLQAKAFLRCLIRHSKAGAGSIPPFRMILIGDRDSFGIPCHIILSKLQRDVSSLNAQAVVNFVHVAPFENNASPEVMAKAVQTLVSMSTQARVVNLHDISAVGSFKGDASLTDCAFEESSALSIHAPLSAKKRTVKIALSCDFDALSAFLGTGEHPDNNMADYSTGIFAGRVGGRRLLRMLQKYQVADKVTWFIPGHTMETFESTVREVVQSGAEIGLHGYAHEGAYQMTPSQEREVLVKCMEAAKRLTGKKVQGYRAPMYQLRETTVELLREFGFLYDSSLSHHDSQPYYLPANPPVQRIDFSQPASSWMHPTPLADMNTAPEGRPIVEIPTGWNNEDMMALQYFPHLHNSHGHVDARVVEQRWKDIFLWLWENGDVDQPDGSFVFPILMHPDTSGMAHVMGMVDRFVAWLRNWGDSVEFHTFSSIAQSWLDEQAKGRQ